MFINNFQDPLFIRIRLELTEGREDSETSDISEDAYISFFGRAPREDEETTESESILYGMAFDDLHLSQEHPLEIDVSSAVTVDGMALDAYLGEEYWDPRRPDIDDDHSIDDEHQTFPATGSISPSRPEILPSISKKRNVQWRQRRTTWKEHRAKQYHPVHV